MSEHDPIFSRRIARRTMLQGTALAGVGAFLAACGTTAQSTAPTAAPTPTPGNGATPVPTAKPTPSDVLNFANWPLYIDQDEGSPPRSPTLDEFTAKYGTKVNYSEAVNDNDQFFGTIQPPLQAGQDTGWDLVVLTDWMASRLVRLGWVETIDTANTPNFVANLRDVYKGVAWDPDTNLRAPWQSGMTGLGFDEAKTGTVTSLEALWTDDPRWKGKVWFLSEMRDTVGLALLKLGFMPEDFSLAQADAAFAEIRKTVDAGIVRSFLGNDYKEGLVKGDLVLGMAWSGDIIQAQLEKESLQFAIPDEGGDLWTDNMQIPKGAAHKYTAELMIDWVYNPAIAAQIAAYVQYVSPVAGAKEAIAQSDDPEVAALADNPLMFPDDATLEKVHIFRSLSEDEEAYLNDEFSKVTGN
ncbi:MAG: spermidine/putrescine ABC transporter substrate-binding protein [Chloroflexota bacterium]